MCLAARYCVSVSLPYLLGIKGKDDGFLPESKDHLHGTADGSRVRHEVAQLDAAQIASFNTRNAGLIYSHPARELSLRKPSCLSNLDESLSS